MDLQRVVIWAFRLAWIALAFTASPAIGQALDDRSTPVQLTAAILSWILWGVVVVASLVPSTVSLTAIRSLAPAAVVAGIVAWMSGASAATGALAVLTALVALALAFAAELGQAFVQASTYGDERRFPLRPFAALALLVPTAWTLSVGGFAAGALLLAAQNWFLGALLTIEGVAVAWVFAPRVHRLSRRWLVVVPAGVVVHDEVMLHETVMVPVAQLAGATVAPGRVLELHFARPLKVALRPRPGQAPDPVEVSVLQVRPSRPGQAMAAVTTRPPPRTKRSVAS